MSNTYQGQLLEHVTNVRNAAPLFQRIFDSHNEVEGEVTHLRELGKVGG